MVAMPRENAKITCSYYGEIFDRPFAVILNSRQSKIPTGNDIWIKKTLDAIDYARDNGLTLLTSIGMKTWELALWGASEKGVPRIITIVSYKKENPEKLCDDIIMDFALLPELTGFLVIETDIPSTRAKEAWHLRDEYTIRDADVLIPISIRDDGAMARFLENFGASKTIVKDFIVGYEGSKMRDFSPLDIDSIASKFPAQEWNYLTHWTHTSNKKWSFETSASYYRDIANSFDEYPRSAFHALESILSKGKIYGGNVHSKKDIPYVSFTELDPAGSCRLMRWRSRWVRYTFEPYGISISKDVADEIGIKPVIYGEIDKKEKLPRSEKVFFHSSGNIGDWQNEREWRFPGDLDLSKVPKENLLSIVRTPLEAKRLQEKTNMRIVFLED